MTDTQTHWHTILELWPQFLELKTATTPPSDGMPRAASNPAERAVLNMNVLVLEIEIEDFVNRQCEQARKHGHNAYNIGDLFNINHPEGQPEHVRKAWDNCGSDFLEEIESLLELKPRPWTQHKLDLLAEYPERFNLTQAQTLIALAMLQNNMARQTLESRIKVGKYTPDENGRLNLGDVLAIPYTPHHDRHAKVL